MRSDRRRNKIKVLPAVVCDGTGGFPCEGAVLTWVIQPSGIPSSSSTSPLEFIRSITSSLVESWCHVQDMSWETRGSQSVNVMSILIPYR